MGMTHDNWVVFEGIHPFHDPVNNPSHYNKGGIECLDAIQAALNEAEFRGYIKGNVIKYVWREQYKNGTEDLRKADFYLDRLLDSLCTDKTTTIKGMAE